MSLVPLYTCAGLITLAAPAAAVPQSIGFGDLVELPTTSDECDHATVAINDHRDVLVCWQSVVWIPQAGQADIRARKIEIAFLPYLESQGRWGSLGLGANHAVVGDPELDLLGSGADACRKPDVSSLGTDFIVAWARNGTGDSEASQMEVIRVRPSGPALTDMTIDAPFDGAGFRVDMDIDSGEAGALVDTAGFELPERSAIVFGANEVDLGGGEREYDLRLTQIDWSTVPPESVTHVLETGIPFDDSPGIGLSPGGLLLADIVADDHGHLVVSRDQYDHRPAASSWLGRIRVHRYQLDWSFAGGSQAVPPLLLDGVALPPPPLTQTEFQRRPNLAASRLDDGGGGNSVSVSWMEAPDVVGGDRDLNYAVLEFLGGAAAGPVGVTLHPFPNVPWREDGWPVPAHGLRFRANVLTSGPTSAASVQSWFPSSTPADMLAPPTPWRPHLDLWEDGSGAPGSRVVATCCEGDGSTGLNVFLRIVRG